MIPRFFCPEPLPDRGVVVLPETVARHAVKVLRLREGSELVLFDGEGSEVAARLLLSPVPSARLLTRSAPRRESPVRITLVQALASGDKMDWIVQKAVELGAASLIPLATERCVLKLSADRAEKRTRHWRQIAVAACEQSGRNRVPEIHEPIELAIYLQRFSAVRRLVMMPGAASRVRDLPPAVDAVHLLVGPEGGWSEAERCIIEAAGCVALGLGPRVLRTETAGIAALAVLQAYWGDL